MRISALRLSSSQFRFWTSAVVQKKSSFITKPVGELCWSHWVSFRIDSKLKISNVSVPSYLPTARTLSSTNWFKCFEWLLWSSTLKVIWKHNAEIQGLHFGWSGFDHCESCPFCRTECHLLDSDTRQIDSNRLEWFESNPPNQAFESSAPESLDIANAGIRLLIGIRHLCAACVRVRLMSRSSHSRSTWNASQSEIPGRPLIYCLTGKYLHFNYAGAVASNL